MSVGTLLEVRMQNETILILLLRVSWHEANSSCKRIFCDNILVDMYFFFATCLKWMIAYDGIISRVFWFLR